MKKFFCSLLSILFIFNLSAQFNDQTCHFGLTFEISTNPCWGYGEPVVLSVMPFSPAEAAGIKPGDIIMEINRTATYLRDFKTISRWFFDESAAEVSFTIRNLNTYFKEYKLRRECNQIGSLSESDLATGFSFYSLENTNDKQFVIPVQIKTNRSADYSDYHTYDFILDKNAPPIDGEISSIIEKSLIEQGLKRDTNDPDFLIQSYYSYQPNMKYNAARKNKAELKTWRFDPRIEKMVLLPILSGDAATAEQEGQFLLEFGIRFFDRKYIDPGQLTQIWDCNAIEYLSDKYSLEEYARIHTPLLMMNYPYSSDKMSATYQVNFKKHHYTGIRIDSRDMKTITDVEKGSPAYVAGIRGGDVIKKLNDYKFDLTVQELTDGYKRFLVETMKYRDLETRFMDANGFPDCMFWDKYQYDKIKKEFKKSIYNTHYSYLYGFEDYVPSSRNLIFEIVTRGQGRIFTLTPEIRSSVTVQIK